MALVTAAIAGPVTAPERIPADITPERTAKQLAAVVKGRGETLNPLTPTWLKAGPFSAQLIQALFCVPFRQEEVSEDQIETLAEIYLKLCRHWPVYTQGSVVWLLGVMRKWWGGLPVVAPSQATPQQRPQRVTHTNEDDDWEPPEEFEISFTTSGSTARVPVSTDYSATIEFSDEDKDTLRDIRWQYRNGGLTKSDAIDRVVELLEERTTDCWCNGNAEEGDDHWDDSYAEIEREEESMSDIWSRDKAVGIVDDWE